VWMHFLGVEVERRNWQMHASTISIVSTSEYKEYSDSRYNLFVGA
jgi:hypothetical protein